MADRRVEEALVRVDVAVDPRPEPGGDLGADRDRRPQRHRSDRCPEPRAERMRIRGGRRTGTTALSGARPPG